MKKKLIFGGALLLALVLTTGTFAYTYTNQSTTTLPATITDAAMTTYQPSAHQPDWKSILPDANVNYEVLLPVADGDITTFSAQFPNTGSHFNKVADMSAPDMNSYISTDNSYCEETDVYRLSYFKGMSGLAKITNVIVYFRVAAGGDYDVTAKGAITIGCQVYEGPSVTVHGTNFVTRSWACTGNPSTNKAWTFADINSLQAGLTGKGSSKCGPLLCTLVYVQVNYTYTLIEGAVPQGDLFDITPYPGYTGDLLVKIYLTDTAALLKAYKYLNMKIYMANTLEAGKTPDYQILSIENGVALFNIQGGAAAKYTVSVSGGAYRIISDKPEEWGEGWSIEPEFYCEVSQR
jgi:hypothetical protein